MTLGAADLALIDRWQRGFPLMPRPYAEVGHALEMDEGEVIGRLGKLRENGVLVRIGAAVRPNTAGASTLAAICVPAARLDEVAGIVTAEPTVNHNYEREHEFNLWFVVTGADRRTIDTVLARITKATGLEVLDLPLERAFHLDLGFPIAGPRTGEERRMEAHPISTADGVSTEDRTLLAALEDGLALEERPYLVLADALASSEDAVIKRLKRLIADRIISRFGLIVRHRALGFSANAMTVFDVPDADVERLGRLLGREPSVTLCYQRPRRPTWPYNLFIMVHGRDRASVREEIETVSTRCGAAQLPRAVLFSRRCFKQKGASLRAA